MREKSPNSKGAEENNQRRSNGRPYGSQPETGDFLPPFTTFVDEADSSGRKVDAMETLNPHVDRMRSSVAVAPSAGAVTSGFDQANLRRHHHHQDDASTSSRGLPSYVARVQLGNDAIVGRGDEAVVEGFQREMKDLEELLSKLNPMAEEFVPSSLAGYGNGGGYGGGCRYSNTFSFQNRNADANAGPSYRKSSYGHEKRRMNSRTNLAQRGEVIRRTVYVSDIDHQVTEEQLAALFISCGQVVDCRICGDPNSILRFAFIEFTDEEGARAALGLSGTMLGYYPVRVLPSKTAIAPVNPTFLPRSEDEREMCARTVYCTNIDKKVTQVDLKLFFESLCGEVYRLRLLGDHHYSTRIAFIEFVQADSATAALNCSGATLGSQPIRVSPSKTPVRPRLPRYSGHQA